MLRYAITDRLLFNGSLDAMQTAIVATASQFDCLQIRERDLPAAALEKFTRLLLTQMADLPRRPRVLVNHRAEVALACAADGVHLRSGGDELTPAQVRHLYRAVSLPAPIVSVSCHTLAEVSRAKDADLILFGPVFEKTLQGQSSLLGTGLALLAEACRAATPTPVLALGGVTEENQHRCLQAGAAGIAGIRYFLQQPE